MGFFSLLLDWVSNMFKLLGLGSGSSGLTLDQDQDRGIQIFVKTNHGRTLPLVLDPDWTIRDVKAELSKKLLQPDQNIINNIRIIFAGKELQDQVKLSDCDIGAQSILHAIQVVQTIPEKNPSSSSPSLPLPPSSSSSSPPPLAPHAPHAPHASDKPLNESLVELSSEDQPVPKGSSNSNSNSNSSKAHFWVYCSSPCQSMKPGKLRVRCRKCREGAIIVERDPCHWEDVLRPQRVLSLIHI